jgi:hypothetical protein
MNKGVIEALKNAQKECPVRFLLDCGAFTAHSTGKNILLDDYCSFLEKLDLDVFAYFGLDVIGDPIKTMENYEIMLRRGFDPVPVFTYGQPVELIEEFYKKTDYVAYGGLVGKKNTHEVMHSIKSVMDQVGDRKIHLLGFTNTKMTKVFRPYSCDSSTWVNGAKYGAPMLYLGNGRSKIITKKDFVKLPDPQIIKALDRLKIPLNEMKKKSSWVGSGFHYKLGMKSWIAICVDYAKHLDVKLFLAGASKKDIGMFTEFYLELNQ